MELIVKPLDRQSAGKGIAAIDPEAMAGLDVSSGDFVTIQGDAGTAVARVRPGQADDLQRGVVGIDGQTRQTTGVRIDQLVRVESAA